MKKIVIVGLAGTIALTMQAHAGGQPNAFEKCQLEAVLDEAPTDSIMEFARDNCQEIGGRYVGETRELCQGIINAWTKRTNAAAAACMGKLTHP
jgi:hypothetical protein